MAVWRNQTLRALAWALAAWQVFRHAFIAVVILFAARDLGFSAGHVGALFMLAGVGSLLSAAAVGPLNARFGLGHVIGRIEEENDGSVAVAETRLSGARDHIVLPVSHSGMLFSREVARQVGHFLTHGTFARSEP